MTRFSANQLVTYYVETRNLNINIAFTTSKAKLRFDKKLRLIRK